jgi:chromosome segregation protein
LRLTHLKLAGFKSFVDPTTLHIHGQRVGVVGPNGCGKSNVMESVRWVLGESSAKEMRGDSMDAVIFNGSGNRKAISRASVELVFDNSLGDASGAWAQYAEISVKRVIERDKGSTYYINNTAVRRRDVADLFLGTGLGGRAYAIIGQNTISRIVEAKPEELRVFLEEAAGISKYKERRRETELRLRDTRENLTRVEDIRQEMAKQISRLESQAVITEKYHALQQSLKNAEGQFWLLRKRDSASQWEKSQRNVEKLVNELEAQMASLRKTESMLETLRQQHYASTEAVQVAQAKYYESNADVANLENQVKHTQEARDRLSLQLEQAEELRVKAENQSIALESQLQQFNLDLLQADEQITESEKALGILKQAVPEAEQRYSSNQKAHAEAQRLLSEAEQSIRLEANHVEHINRSSLDLKQRLDRLVVENNSLILPDTQEISVKQVQLNSLEDVCKKLAGDIHDLKEKESTRLEAIKALRSQQLVDERSLANVEAQISSLTKIQSSINQEAHLDDWLKHTQLESSHRVWQYIDVKKGWETALESALGHRLNALIKMDGAITPNQRPPSAIMIAEPLATSSKKENQDGWRLLSDLVVVKENALVPLIETWLNGFYLLEDGADPELARLKLGSNEYLLNQLGDIYSRNTLFINAASSLLNGVLERQRELSELNDQLPTIKATVELTLIELARLEGDLQEGRHLQQQKQQDLNTQTQAQHLLNIDIQKLEQQRQHVLDRQAAVQLEIVQTNEKLKQAHDEQAAKQSLLNATQAALSELKNTREQTFANRQSAETALNALRNDRQSAETALQEKIFNQRIINNSINELKSKYKALQEEKDSLSNKKKEFLTLLDAAKMDGLKTNLEAAVALRQTREEALALARDNMAGAENELQSHERNRMQNEQVLHPLRDKVEQSRLQEQQARLVFEQCQASLNQIGIDEQLLSEGIATNTKIQDLDLRTQSIKADIEALGPVNLAAIQELNSERERKTYLDSQAADLEEAILTLEDAIHKIDKETRNRLQQTYDEANRHFGELFKDLFGGGQARLELLGDEILDTGMQVFAQPPGKKNSTIHLLSGGEKALTALALVFALFKLNPAPFCLMDEVDAPLDDSNTDRFCAMVKKMSERTQFLFVSHNKITMEMAQQLVGVTMQESGVSRVVEVDMEAAMQMNQELFIE